jgi:hypothetical protein
MRRRLSTRKYMFSTHTLYSDIRQHRAAVLRFPLFLDPDTSNLEHDCTTKHDRQHGWWQAQSCTHWKDYTSLALHRSDGLAPAVCARAAIIQAIPSHTAAALYLIPRTCCSGGPSSTSYPLPYIPDNEHQTTLSSLFQHVRGFRG